MLLQLLQLLQIWHSGMWTASGSQLYTPAQKPHKKKTWGSAQHANASQEEKLKFTKVHSAKKILPAKTCILTQLPYPSLALKTRFRGMALTGNAKEARNSRCTPCTNFKRKLLDQYL
jgi:hypothetical protein